MGDQDLLTEAHLSYATDEQSLENTVRIQKRGVHFSIRTDNTPSSFNRFDYSPKSSLTFSEFTCTKTGLELATADNSICETELTNRAHLIKVKQVQPLSKSTQDVMLTLDEQFKVIDFWDRAALKHGESLKNKHYLIITSEEILAQANHNGWGIGQRNDFPYIYNGAYWISIEAGELRAFLRRVAQKMGVNKFDAKYHLFADQLYKQFMELSNIPHPAPKPGIVLINLKNGTFEISPQGKQLRLADRSDFLTYQLPFSYDPSATAPLFDKYLLTVQPDEECRQLLAEFIGYLFINSGWLKLEKALILYGSGANGKSVFFEIIIALLGPQNVSNYSLSSLTDEKGYHRAKLQNVLVNYASEITDKLEANTFKQLASGEPIEARLPYGQPFILTNYLSTP